MEASAIEIGNAEKFLATWEADGRPVVDSVHYDNCRASTRKLYKHHATTLAAQYPSVKFSDDGRFVELEFEPYSGNNWTKIIYDRLEPGRGRWNPETEVHEAKV